MVLKLGNNAEKFDFFENATDVVNELKELYDCDDVLIMGDFNLALEPSETKNRSYSSQEKRVADYVRDLSKAMELKDCWSGISKSFTWRRGNSDIFSTIDRIMFSEKTLELEAVKSDWTLSLSDHAAVIAAFRKKDYDRPIRSKITRLDPSLAKNVVTSEEISRGFDEMIGTMPLDWIPHLKLEFAKMCI